MAGQGSTTLDSIVTMAQATKDQTRKVQSAKRSASEKNRQVAESSNMAQSRQVFTPDQDDSQDLEDLGQYDDPAYVQDMMSCLNNWGVEKTGSTPLVDLVTDRKDSAFATDEVNDIDDNTETQVISEIEFDEVLLAYIYYVISRAEDQQVRAAAAVQPDDPGKSAIFVCPKCPQFVHGKVQEHVDINRANYERHLKTQHTRWIDIELEVYQHHDSAKQVLYCCPGAGCDRTTVLMDELRLHMLTACSDAKRFEALLLEHETAHQRKDHDSEPHERVITYKADLNARFGGEVMSVSHFQTEIGELLDDGGCPVPVNEVISEFLSEFQM